MNETTSNKRKKRISLPTYPPTSEHIGNFVNIPLWDEWYDSAFENYENMKKFTTFSSSFEISLLQRVKKIQLPRIWFKAKTTYIENQYELYSRTCAYGSYII